MLLGLRCVNVIPMAYAELALNVFTAAPRQWNRFFICIFRGELQQWSANCHPDPHPVAPAQHTNGEYAPISSTN